MYTSDTKETPNPNNANVESNTSTLQLSSTYNNGVQGPESSNSLGPPPYTKNAPLDDPFRGGDAHVGYFYPKSKGVQKDFRPATATRVDLPSATTTPLEPLPPVPTDDADSFAVDVVLDGSLLPPQPLPARPSGLKRGLQIPSRVSLITWGFSFPPVLAEQGVTKSQWKLFKHELKAFARLSLGQWVTVIACTQGVSLLFGQIIGQFSSAIRYWSMSLNSGQVMLSVTK